MKEYWVICLDVEDQAPAPTFECIAPPEAPAGLIKEVLIMGNAETEDVHIHWRHWRVNNTKLHLVTCTNGELTAQKARELALQAVKFAEEQDA